MRKIVFLPKRDMPSDELEPWALQQSDLEGAALEYLDDVFRDAFKREEENNEAIWRSLPFFAALLGIALTFLARAATGRPAWFDGFLGVGANTLFWLSVLSFAWTIRWLWELLRPRSYRYPSPCEDVWKFAEEIHSFQRTQAPPPRTLGDAVERDLKAHLSRQFGAAASHNMLNNRAKFEARSQLLLFMLLGFVLVISAEGIKYVYDLTAYRIEEHSNVARPLSTPHPGSLQPRATERTESSEASKSPVR